MPARTRLTLLVVAAVLVSVSAATHVAAWRLPGNDQGYAPMQPIAYSHRLHAGELEIDCLFCHSGAERSRHAGVPSADVCMACHASVVAPLGEIRAEEKRAKEAGEDPRPIVSTELRKLYDALGLDANLKRDESLPLRPIEWVRVHDLPDFVTFDHRSHVNVGVTCQTCHGPIESMERVRQESDLSMGWCVNCHRDANANGINGRPVEASLDCAVCHQ